ncbi:hypothetical protein ACWCPM_34380 [Streptomyces sp. NPDC002309]
MTKVTWWRQVRPSAGETHVLFFTETEAREWATRGKKAADGPNLAALPVQASPVRMQKPPTSDTQPAAVPADPLADAWSTTPTNGGARPGLGSGRRPSGDVAGGPGRRPPGGGLRDAAEHHLPYTLAALRYACVCQGAGAAGASAVAASTTPRPQIQGPVGRLS